MVAHELMSVIAIPLRGRETDRLLGLLYLDSRWKTGGLSRVSKDILHAIATEAANLVEYARMVQAQREADLVRKELEIASSIQQSIIPSELPSFSYAKLTAKTVPCTAVGGDFYDVIPVNDGFVAIVADVSGKGMSAALLASIIQGMMYAQIMSGSVPALSCGSRPVIFFIALGMKRAASFAISGGLGTPSMRAIGHPPVT